MIEALRTHDDHFINLPGHPFALQYLEHEKRTSHAPS